MDRDTFKFPFQIQVPSSHDVTQNSGETHTCAANCLSGLSQPETFYKSKTGPVVLSV